MCVIGRLQRSQQGVAIWHANREVGIGVGWVDVDGGQVWCRVGVHGQIVCAQMN